MAYLSRAHEDPAGRWGNAQMRRSVRPRTIHTYFGNLRTLFRFLVAEGALDESPMKQLRPPVPRHDQIQPFSQDQVHQLLTAGRQPRHPRRDECVR